MIVNSTVLRTFFVVLTLYGHFLTRTNVTTPVTYEYKSVVPPLNIQNDTVSEISSRAITVKLATFEPGGGLGDLQGNTTVHLVKGVASFEDINIARKGKNYKLEFSMNPVPNFGQVYEYTSDLIQVVERPVKLKLTTDALPFHQEMNMVVNPAPGVQIIDVLTGKPAGKEALGNYRWEATLNFRYKNKIYESVLIGLKTQDITRKNRILFENIFIGTQPAYRVFLKITVQCIPIPERKFKINFGPFDVYDTSPQMSSAVWNVSVELQAKEGDIQFVFHDIELFQIWFLNKFGIKFKALRWGNFSASKTGNKTVMAKALVSGSWLSLNTTKEKFKNDLKIPLSLNGRDLTITSAQIVDPNTPTVKKVQKENNSSSTYSLTMILLLWSILILQLAQ